MCIPLKKYKIYANDKPWVSKDIIRLIGLKQDAHMRGDKKLYHTLKHQITRDMHRQRKEYIKNVQQHLVKEPAKAWHEIKKISGLTADISKPSIDIPYSPDAMNKFYARFEQPRSEIKTTSNATDFPRFEIDSTAVLKELRHINPRKGAGPDGLIPRILKICAEQLTPVITRLFQASISAKITPQIWKTATIKPLPKTSKPSQIKDYRPIALTCCLCKILEKLLKRYICANTPLDRYQFAYRAKRSCQDALLCLTTTVTNFVDKAAANYARCLFLDFSSAFNTIDTAFLISQLAHLDPNVTQWVASFLTSRVQRTMVNGKLSSAITTNTGTPQGSVLSPVLFSIYTNGITSAFTNVTVLKYADDTCIIGCISNTDDLDNYFNEINRIATQCQDLNLLLNAAKTREMLFSTKRVKPESRQLVLNGVNIAFSDSVKYLGIELDCNLRYETHVSNIVRKARQRMYIVRLFYTMGSLPLTTMMFKSFILSLILYCMPVMYQSLRNEEKKQLRRFFSFARALGLVEIDDLDTIIRDRTMRLAFNYIHDDDHFIHNFLEKCPSGRYRNFKIRSAWGRDSFYRRLVLLLNDVL